MHSDDVEIDFDLYPISEPTITALRSHGLLYRSDFRRLKPRDLEGLGISRKDANDVLRYLRAPPHVASSNPIPDPTASQPSSVLTLLRNGPVQDGTCTHVTTFCQAVDDILGGGIERGSVTEICGVPGIGKTQFAMQLCLTVQLPSFLNGAAGRAALIDTEGSISTERVEIMALAVVKVVNRMQEKRRASGLPAAPRVTVEGLVGGIEFYRVFRAIELTSLVLVLGLFLKENRDVKLIVIDSVTSLFRFEFADMVLRSRLLQGMAQKLSQLANEFHVAIVVVNQMTTKINPLEASHLTPALGHSWAHACRNRILLYRKGENRCALLYKSPSLPPNEAFYEISRDGVRGVSLKRQRDEPHRSLQQ